MALEILHLAVAIRFVNMALLAYLTLVYWKSFRKIRSSFTVGLLLFSVILFLNNLFAVYFRLFSGVDIGDELSVQNTILNLLQALGLMFLVYIARE